MNSSAVSLPVKWKEFLDQMASDHHVDLNSIISELCEWAFSDGDGMKQFETWLDDAFPEKGEAQDKETRKNEEISEDEDEADEESEEETHEHRD